MSTDRVLGVAGLIATLLGTGLVWLIPTTTRWPGWVFLGLGVALLLWFTIRWLVGFNTVQVPQLPAGPQTLTQSGITIENNPHNEFKPSVVVNVPVSQTQQSLLQQRWAMPTIKGVEPEVIQGLVDSENEMQEFDVVATSLLGVRSVSIALARFFYEPEEDVDPWLEVTANVFFADTNGVHKLSVYETVWYEGKRKTATFVPGGSATLIIALQEHGVISAVKYDFKDDGRGGQRAVPGFKKLDGRDFMVAVRLVGRGEGGVIRFDGKEHYVLKSESTGLVLKRR